MSEANGLAVVVISEELARGIRAYLGSRGYDEVAPLIGRLEREVEELTAQILAKLQEKKS